jgi:hypothetical protein
MEDGATPMLNGDSKVISVYRSRASSTAHKRSTSGGILSRLGIIRSNSEGTSPTSPTKKSPTKEELTKEEPGEELLHQGSQQHNMESAMAAAMRQHNKTRKRKGSLRKTALLTTGRLRFDRRTSVDQQDYGEPVKSPPLTNGQQEHAIDTEAGYDASPPSISTSSAWILPPPSQVLKLDTVAPTNGTLSPTQQDNQLLSPDSITSPISRYASTTSDDDALHLPLTSAAGLTRRRSTLRNPSIAIPPPSRIATSPAPHNPSDTEYWGWIILFSTWIVFVVGMGSCLGVWSWAWDVGETPYAPPELEDDPTLPIVGYYPALIVCTGVMAWVWCLVAWVGMKYFRHARFEGGGGGDDG